MYNSFERSIFRCPIIDKRTERDIYPEPSEESIMLYRITLNKI